MKKFVSIILVLVLSLSCFALCAFAADEETPVIVISGMNAYPLYDEDGNFVYPMSMETLFKNVPPIAGGAVASLLSSNWKYLKDYGIEPIANLFAGIACDESGASVNELHTELFPESLDNYREHFQGQTTNQEGAARAIADEIGWENVYFMNYDWRIGAVEHAETLNEYVQRAMEEHGCDKVTLVPMSFGGTIVNAYLMNYGAEHIKNIVFASTAFNGVELVGRLFSGDPSITLREVMTYMSAFTQDYDGLTDVLAAIASAEGKFKLPVESYIDRTVVSLVEELGDEVYEKIFGSSFAHMKGMWGLMPNEYYESAKAYMKAHTEFSADFFDDLDNYFAFQGNLRSTLNSLISDGVNVYVTGSYGFAGIPVSKGAAQRTDTLIETYLMTGDSVVAPYGKTLDDIEYEKSGCAEHNHISTDNIIDASTCFLPEQTWFVKGIGHLKYTVGTRAMDLIVWLAMSDELVSVSSDEHFPQFIKINKNTGAASSLTEGVEFDESEVTPFAVILAFLRAMLKFAMKLFGFSVLS